MPLQPLLTQPTTPVLMSATTTTTTTVRAPAINLYSESISSNHARANPSKLVMDSNLEINFRASGPAKLVTDSNLEINFDDYVDHEQGVLITCHTTDSAFKLLDYVDNAMSEYELWLEDYNKQPVPAIPSDEKYNKKRNGLTRINLNPPAKRAAVNPTKKQ